MDANAVVTRLTMVASPFMKGVGQAIQGLSKFSGALKGGALALVGVGLALKPVLSEMIKFETQTAELSKLLGKEIAAPLAQSISDLSTRLPVLSERLFNVAAAAARLGIRGRDNILEFTETMAMIEVATDMTAEAAAQNFARIAAVTQTPVSQVRRLADVANQLSNNMATSFTEVITSAGELAPIFQNLGLPVEQTFAFAAALNQVNVNVRRGAQRFRSFAQQLTQDFRADEIAGAIGLTTEAFEEMVDKAPLEVMLRIAQRMNAGGEAARRLAQAFDSAGSLGVSGLSQDLEGLQKALNLANTEMIEGGSLTSEYGEFAGTAAAKSVLLRNQIDALQRNVGRQFLPIWKKLLDGFSDFIDLLDHITSRPFENFLSEDQMARLQGSVRDAISMAEAEVRGYQFSGHSALLKVMGDHKDVEEEIQKTIRMLDGALNQMSDSIRPKVLADITHMMSQPGFKATGEELRNLYGALIWNASLAGEAVEEEFFKPTEDGFETLNNDVEESSINLQALQNAVRDMGIDVSKLSEEEAKLVANLAMARAEMDHGATQAKFLQRALEGVGLGFNVWLTFAELALEHQEQLNTKQEEAEEHYKATKEALRLETIELERGAEARMRAELAAKGLSNERVRELILAQRHVDALEKEKEALEDAEKERERYAKQLQKHIDDLNLVTLQSQMDLLQRTTSEMSRAVVDTFSAMASGAENAGDAIVNMISRIAQAIISNRLEAFFTKLAMNAFNIGGGPDLSGLNIATSGILGRASGGDVFANRSYVIGERGPELFVPKASGHIVPNHEMGGGGGTVVVQNTFEIRALDGASVREILSTEADFITTQTAQKVARSSVLKEMFRR